MDDQRTNRTGGGMLKDLLIEWLVVPIGFFAGVAIALWCGAGSSAAIVVGMIGGVLLTLVVLGLSQLRANRKNEKP